MQSVLLGCFGEETLKSLWKCLLLIGVVLVKKMASASTCLFWEG